VDPPTLFAVCHFRRSSDIDTIEGGDIVVQYRHYEFGDTGGVLIDGPDNEFEGTRWRVKEIAAEAEYRSIGSGLTEQARDPYVELELVEGEYKEAAPSPTPPVPDDLHKDDLDWIVAQQKAWVTALSESMHRTVTMPLGYTMQINNTRAYRRHYPNRDLNQQFFEEWKRTGDD